MKELKAQLGNALLVILTVAAVICAGINYQQQKLFPMPEDGVTWMDRESAAGEQVVAVHIQPGSAAEKAGLRAGDILKQAGGTAIHNSQEVMEVLLRVGVWRTVEYTVERRGVELPAKVILEELERDTALLAQYAVGAAWLAIGLFIYFRRRRARHSLHFYLICLASFVLHTFHYTGKLNNFDAAIYLMNAAAGLLAPAIFLHFCLTFPERPENWNRWRVLSVYLPPVSLLALQLAFAVGVVRTPFTLLEVRWALDRAWLILFTGAYLAGGVKLHRNLRHVEDAITRQQLKWLRNGTLLGTVPFLVLYAAPYAYGAIPVAGSRMAVLFLGMVPLTWAYAILRYRLMDVDIIFQQGYVYMLATVSVLGVVYALVYALTRQGELSSTAVVLLVLVAAFVFEPLRNWIQQQLDRYIFYKDRYDYRRTLIAFARELSAEMNLDATLAKVGERLLETLSLERVAFFLYAEADNQFHLHTAADRGGVVRAAAGADLDLSFLETQPERPYLFFERTRRAFDVVSREMSPAVRATIARLDLTYYLPCVYRGRTVAWLGVSRTTEGDFLSSDDVDLVATLAGYVGMAVENSRLYRRLADKAEQYERLKEFNENIVESLNVGILAADLDDCVESWNSQLERLTGIPRESAVGRPLVELFPPELAVQFEAARDQSSVSQLYKFPLRLEELPLNDGRGGGERHEVTLNIAIAPLVAKDQERIGRLILFDDVTERELLERRLMQADKLSSIGLLAAGVAHEVNTPLAVISTYAQMLAKQVAGDDQKSKLLDKIARQTFRASEIVNSLLNFSRTSSTEFEEVDLNKVIRETLALLEHQLEKARVTVTAELDPALPAIRGNTGKLQQVFLNLFLNARDAMDATEQGGRLHVRTRLEDGAVRAEVADSGPGIPREHLTRIFDPFFTTKAARKGTGLGLSITYGIVEEHGGSIQALSDAGQGAAFRMDFPPAAKTVNA